MSYQSGLKGADKVGYYDAEDGLGTGGSRPSKSLKDDIINVEPVPLRQFCSACWSSYCRGLPKSIESSFRNRYLFANVVYVIYALIIIWIDFKAYPDANALYPTGSYVYYDDDGSSSGSEYYYSYGDSSAYDNAINSINNLFVAAGVIHLINAFMYAWSWLPLGYTWCSIVMIPEYLNMIGAAIYLYTSTQYGNEDGTYLDDTTFKVHHLETAAATIEIIAAFGWCFTWWLTYPRGVPGRGWTLDDPDIWANVFIVVPSIFYVAYNVQILNDPASYCCNTLYSTGDILYAAGAFFYLFASMRDDGYFACLPAAGACAHGCDVVTPLDPYSDPNTPKYLCGCPPLHKWPCFACCDGGSRSEGGCCNSCNNCKRRAEAQALLK